MTDKGATHWEGCYQHAGHHQCAIAEVERLRARVAEIEIIADAVDCASFNQLSLLRWDGKWAIEQGPGVVGPERFDTLLGALLALRRWMREAVGVS